MSNLKEELKKVTGQLLSVLSARNRDIISRRFGLKTGKRETLESIGQSYGITRERVRQIEEASLRLIRENTKSAKGVNIKPFVSLAVNVLEQAGGVLSDDSMFEKFFGSQGQKSQSLPAHNASLAFMLAVDGNLKRHTEDESFNSFWSLGDQHSQSFKTTVASMVNALKNNKSTVHDSVIGDFWKNHGLQTKSVPGALLLSYAFPSKELGKNIFGDVGLTSWPEIKPRGVRDKSYLVLKREKKPLHFTSIAKLINSFGFSGRKANVQTVHNELIKDNRFVLVGRGMYGLSEWGYKSGTVKDVLVDLFKDSSKPLHKDEIVQYVLSHRMVKENTILLNLQDSNTFNKKGDGFYELREA